VVLMRGGDENSSHRFLTHAEFVAGLPSRLNDDAVGRATVLNGSIQTVIMNGG